MSKRRFAFCAAILAALGMALGAAAYTRTDRLSTLFVAGGTIEDVVESASGSDVTFQALTVTGAVAVTGSTIDLDPTDAVTLDMAAGKQITITTTENNAAALTIQDKTGDDYILINTSTGSESMSFGNATDNNNFTFLGSGNLTGTTGLINFGGALSGIEIANGTDLPDTCTVGTLFLDTDDDACSDAGGGDGCLCLCKTSNTFAVVQNI